MLEAGANHSIRLIRRHNYSFNVILLIAYFVVTEEYDHLVYVAGRTERNAATLLTGW